MRVRYTLQAKADLEDIFTYIARDNPAAARRVITAIRRDIVLLADNPEIGRRGRIDGTRELVISRLPYIAAYRAADGFVDVLAVIHTARDWPSAI
jgi:addiction module RelE/StbE family toxin